MYSSEYLKKICKIFILIFLCSEMQSSVTQNSTFEERILDYSTNISSTRASFTNARHHASIRLKELDQNFGEGHICSGAVIAPSVVLTTAQCVYNYRTNKPYHPSELKVVLASIRRYQRLENTLIFSVTHSYQPKTFNALSLHDNLAVLMLEKDIPATSEHVKPITSYNSNQIYNTNWYDKKQNKENLKVTTWLKNNEGLSLNQLMLLNATQLNDDICTNYYGSTLYTAGMLCVNTLEVLNADFGSPLFVDQKLVGLKSFASGYLSPAIYTEVSHYAKWIHEVIGDGSNQNGTLWGSMGFLLFTLVTLKRTKFIKL